ncbi:MAG: SRPBCC family protein [Verrucomicrobia bacterium]|nr:MAG: SRPBCC family protein [Verrucomicrobiota bacterium]TAE86349.1 MAG: SRPBCC family protein [Verrucomicrobiota bacterium]TAF24365.1 MAG: SRPBCC family protein [Verrucomicrobiota bacterium]
MPSATIHESMPRRAAVVFDLLHDYARRMEWDTLLREARLTRGYAQAAKGATSLCVGKALFGWVGIETRYLVFSPGRVAAVEMIGRAPFFERFAASIRHEDEEEGGGSLLTYKLAFTARPACLRWLLEPMMLVFLRHETRKRLRSLSEFLRKD